MKDIPLKDKLEIYKDDNGAAAKKTLTALVKEAEASAAQARENMLSSNSNANNAADSCHRAIQARYQAAHASRAAKWCAAIAAASAIISIIAAAI